MSAAVVNCVYADQGTYEWHMLRKKMVTATDACIIMGANRWKTPFQLYQEKISDEIVNIDNEAMRRGRNLEPVARELFEIESGIKMMPAVLTRDDWALASLDGLSECQTMAVEIKCPGEKTHNMAKNGQVPDYYYPQLQHQMFVGGFKEVIYYSFDGVEAVSITVKRDDNYIEKMVKAELEFLACLRERRPPDLKADDFILQDSDEWTALANNWKNTKRKMEFLQAEEKAIRERLLELAGDCAAKGAGISLSKITRKGAIDYGKVPELKNVDLEKYRKAESSFWTIREG